MANRYEFSGHKPTNSWVSIVKKDDRIQVDTLSFMCGEREYISELGRDYILTDNDIERIKGIMVNKFYNKSQR